MARKQEFVATKNAGQGPRKTTKEERRAGASGKRVAAIIFWLVAVAIVVEPYTKWYHRLADILIYNNHNHYLPCSALPELNEVEEIVSQHQDVVEQIENLSSEGNIEFVIDSMTCQRKGSIIIYYASKAERKLIDEILPDKTFFGVPVSLINR